MEQWTPTLRKCRRWMGGILFVSTLWFTSQSGFILLSVLYLPGFLFGLPSAQWIFDTLTSFWFAFAVGIYELIYGVKIVIQGDVRKLSKNRCSLIIMNHRTRLDWLLYFSVQARYGSLRRFKIALKDEIRHVPGAGWAMQATQFLFLKRKWQIDKNRVDITLKKFKQNSLPPQLLFFPEGTDFRGMSRQKSRDYAKKNELEDYEYVLHPRTLGFTSVVNNMKEYNNLDQIVDATVSYPRTMLQNETELVTGKIPREVVFTIHCYDLDQVPTENEPKLIRWLEDRWQEKEEFLRCFYENKEYSDSNGYTKEQNIEIERDTKLYLVGAILFWALLIVFTLYYLMFSYGFRMVYGTTFMMCILLSTCVGFDTLFSNI
ncbi:lysocardiolipin acyltransferase 1-like [Mercenaria mercenaria]|uniref:lysocardiolipin acyltransferase 1-like n=1 Tax=Mercenaria mercenaria TaxID=6596 RepID=UPI00234EB6A1|nr:lysocardiolipin acyltransferase 1-like [Mercenaria mercenaria]